MSDETTILHNNTGEVIGITLPGDSTVYSPAALAQMALSWRAESERRQALERQVAELQEVVHATRAYLAVKKSWDNQLRELRALKALLAALEGSTR